MAAALCAVLAGCGAQSTAPDTEEGSRNDGADSAGGKAFTLVASGDVIPYPSIIRQSARDAGGDGHDFTRILAEVRPVVEKADLAICHMETPSGAAGGPFTGYPLFRSPPQLAASLRATGYDSCSTASNHTMDAGPRGVRRTLDALDEAGLKHAGSARSKAERNKPVLLEAGDATVAQLAYTYGTNGIPLPEGKPWAVNLLDPGQVIADARAARRAGADVVVVSLHWGTEWQQKPDAQQLKLADRLTRSRHDGRRDIDLILGTHNHVPQPYEKVNGTWVVYGLGDQVAGLMNDPRGQMGSAARFTFTPPREKDGQWRVTKAEFVPFLMESEPSLRVVGLNSPQRGSDGGGHHATARETIKGAVLSRDAAADGLTMGH